MRAHSPRTQTGPVPGLTLGTTRAAPPPAEGRAALWDMESGGMGGAGRGRGRGTGRASKQVRSLRLPAENS